MAITAKAVQEAIDRLELTTATSESLDHFVERYELTDDAMELFMNLMEGNLETLIEALSEDMKLAGKGPAMHVMASLAAMHLTSFMLGYVTCLITEGKETT